MKNRLKIAMYLRLSKEDDRNTQESQPQRIRFLPVLESSQN